MAEINSRKFKSPKTPETNIFEELPILKYEQEIKEAIKENETLIIIGETGSGKTTRLPLFILETIKEGKIVVTQPRRVAARSVAEYTAKLYGCNVGEEVGYIVRFDDMTTEGTIITFMTDGILLRKIQQDPLLSEYSVVMIDEAHERSVNIDLCLGALKVIQEKRKQEGLPPLKIIISSATIEKEVFEKFFAGCKTLEIPGRLYPVDIYYESTSDPEYTIKAAEKAFEIVNKILSNEEKRGNILIFMPTVATIKETIKYIKHLLMRLEKDLEKDLSNEVEILELYGDLPLEEQIKIFEPSDKIRIIVATNIAETSITVPGVKYVIDSGRINDVRFNPNRGVEERKIVFHSKAGVTQRAGRAGRLAPGKCFRIYTEEDFQKMPASTEPEILKIPLTHVALYILNLGYEDPLEFPFITPPDKASLRKSLETLELLGAVKKIDEDKLQITKIGKEMLDYPVAPEYAKMLVEAKKMGCVNAVATAIAFLGLRSVFIIPPEQKEQALKVHREFKKIEGNENSDFLVLIDIFNEWVNNHYDERWARSKFLNSNVLQEASQIREQILEILREKGVHIEESFEIENFLKAIASGLIANLLVLESDYYSPKYIKYESVFQETSGIRIDQRSTLSENERFPTFIVCSKIPEVKTTRGPLKIAVNNSEVKPEWLIEFLPNMVETKIKPIIDIKEKKISEAIITYTLKYRDKSRFLKEDEFKWEDLDEEMKKLAYSELAGMIMFNPSNIFENVDILMQNGIIFNYTQLTERLQEIKKLFPDFAEDIIIPTRSEFLDKLTKFLYENDITDLSLLQEKIINDGEKAGLSIYSYMPEELREIIKDHPTSIIIEGSQGRSKEFSVYYKKDSTGKIKGYIIFYTFERNFFKEISSPVYLPSGKELGFRLEARLSEIPEDLKNENYFRERGVNVAIDQTDYFIFYSCDDFENFKKFSEIMFRKLDIEEERKENEKRKRELLEKESSKEEDITKFIDTYLSQGIQPIEYARDPETNEPLFLYPGLSKSTFYRRESLYLKYFESKEEAEKSTEEAVKSSVYRSFFEKYIDRYFPEKGYQQFKEILEKFKEILPYCPICLNELNYEYKLKYLSYNERKTIEFDHYDCYLRGMASYFLTEDKMDNEINGYYRLGRFRDENGNEIGSFLYRERGGIIIKLNYPYIKEWWLGPRIQKLIFEDEGLLRIIEYFIEDSVREIKGYEKYKEKLIQESTPLQIDEIGVGKFTIGRHPKTGEDQYEINREVNGVRIKYILDFRSAYPQDLEKTYIFEVSRILVDQPKFKLFSVIIRGIRDEEIARIDNEIQKIAEELELYRQIKAKLESAN